MRTISRCRLAAAAAWRASVSPSSTRTRGAARAGLLGEIWVAGPNVAQGYWRNGEATAATFRAQIAGETDDVAAHRRPRFPRCGGRAVHQRADQGPHHHPRHQSLSAGYRGDRAGESSALHRDCGAAFAAVDARGAETLVVVQEVERTQRNKVSLEELEGTIREAVVTEHECVPDHIVLLRPGGIPKTTSGKIQRSLTRQLWLAGALDVLEPG